MGMGCRGRHLGDSTDFLRCPILRSAGREHYPSPHRVMALPMVAEGNLRRRFCRCRGHFCFVQVGPARRGTSPGLRSAVVWAMGSGVPPGVDDPWTTDVRVPLGAAPFVATVWTASRGRISTGVLHPSRPSLWLVGVAQELARTLYARSTLGDRAVAWPHRVDWHAVPGRYQPGRIGESHGRPQMEEVAPVGLLAVTGRLTSRSFCWR